MQAYANQETSESNSPVVQTHQSHEVQAKAPTTTSSSVWSYIQSSVQEGYSKLVSDANSNHVPMWSHMCQCESSSHQCQCGAICGATCGQCGEIRAIADGVQPSVSIQSGLLQRVDPDVLHRVNLPKAEEKDIRKGGHQVWPSLPHLLVGKPSKHAVSPLKDDLKDNAIGGKNDDIETLFTPRATPRAAPQPGARAAGHVFLISALALVLL